MNSEKCWVQGIQPLEGRFVYCIFFHVDWMFLELKANCFMMRTIFKVQINCAAESQFKQKLFKWTVKHSCIIFRYSSEFLIVWNEKPGKVNLISKSITKKQTGIVYWAWHLVYANATCSHIFTAVADWDNILNTILKKTCWLLYYFKCKTFIKATVWHLFQLQFFASFKILLYTKNTTHIKIGGFGRNLRFESFPWALNGYLPSWNYCWIN